MSAKRSTKATGMRSGRHWQPRKQGIPRGPVTRVTHRSSCLVMYQSTSSFCTMPARCRGGADGASPSTSMLLVPAEAAAASACCCRSRSCCCCASHSRLSSMFCRADTRPGYCRVQLLKHASSMYCSVIPYGSTAACTPECNATQVDRSAFCYCQGNTVTVLYMSGRQHGRNTQQACVLAHLDKLVLLCADGDLL